MKIESFVQRLRSAICQLLVFGAAGALSTEDGACLVEQGILYALAMFGESVGGQVVRRKIAALACFFGLMRSATCDMTVKGKYNLLFLGL